MDDYKLTAKLYNYDPYDPCSGIRFEVPGDPVPWSAPTRGRWGGSLPNKRLVDWQQTVKDAAKKKFGPMSPWEGPVVLSAEFRLSRNMPASAKDGDPACPLVLWDDAQGMNRFKGKSADLTNLIKAIEDAMENVVYVNDAQVACHHECKSVWSKQNPGLFVSVYKNWIW